MSRKNCLRNYELVEELRTASAAPNQRVPELLIRSGGIRVVLQWE
jgi:hypothetical protein